MHAFVDCAYVLQDGLGDMICSSNKLYTGNAIYLSEGWNVVMLFLGALGLGLLVIVRLFG